MKTEIPIFNYQRHRPEFRGNYIPRIVFPLKLRRHSCSVVSQVDCDGLQMVVGKHKLPDGKIVYVHRLTPLDE